MNIFKRRISTTGLKALDAMANESGENWWKDLLSLWRPSGQPCGEDGLRLAIRKGSLDFYFQGQSIANVRFDRGGAPYIKTHIKYVADLQKVQDHAKLVGNQISLPHSDKTLPYNGVHTIREWIGRASNYTHKEKQFVDGIMEANESIIDVEMALPAWGERTSALRMDFVTLADKSGEIRITCWEAKLLSDARLVSKAEPEVIQQIQSYKDFLRVQDHCEHVQTAYREVCKLLMLFKGMAERCGHPGIALTDAIARVAKGASPLTIHPDLHLVILNDTANGERANWSTHETKLKQHGIYPIYFEVSDRSPRRLPENIA